MIMRKILPILILFALSLPTLKAQTAHAYPSSSDRTKGQVSLGGYALIDNHNATGTLSGAALFANYHRPLVDLRLGAELATSSRIALDLRCRINLFYFQHGTLYGQNRYLYRQFPNLDLQEFTGALQLAWEGRHINWEFGLANRYMAPLVQRNNGGMSTIFEPMNVMFALEGWWFLENSPLLERTWNLGFRWSNYNDFVIERVANWFYSVKGYYKSLPNLCLTIEAGIHPVGSLNLTSSYDGWFSHLGAIYSF